MTEDCFDGRNMQLLSGQQLVNLQEKHLFSEDVSWDKESLGCLLRKAGRNIGDPEFYIIPEALSDPANEYITEKAALLDHRRVWAIWSKNAEEASCGN